jgi:uncharacterized damage-inducible protein DinB
MMKQLLQQYAGYNLWANSKMTEAVNLLGAEQQQREIVSSFNSIYKTVFHVWGAEFLWWKRVHKAPHISRLEDQFNGSMEELCKTWNELDKQWLGFVNDITDTALNEKLDYQSMKGDPFSNEIYLILQHVFNHSTYHRGQMVTMLRQVGAEKIPNGDFIAWTRMGK